MPWKPKIRAPLIKCGSCPKSYRLGERHTCVTRLDRKARKPRAAKLTAPRVQIWTCPDCGKPVGLGHSCRTKTDFRKRKQAHAKAEADRVKREAAERKKAAAARKRSGRHDPEDCEDADCDVYGCVLFRRGWQKGHDVGYGAGAMAGHAEGYDQGYGEGHAAGSASGG